MAGLPGAATPLKSSILKSTVANDHRTSTDAGPSVLQSNSNLTRLYQVLHGGEPLVDGCANRAVYEHPRQVGVAHQGPPSQPRCLIGTPDVPSHQGCQTVRPGDVLKLAPPAGHHQGHVETWLVNKELLGEEGHFGSGSVFFCFWFRNSPSTKDTGMSSA